MITRKKVFVFLFLACFEFEFGFSRALRRGIDFQDCGSKYEIILLDISSCDTLPCTVEQGQFVTITFELEQRDSLSESDMVNFDAYWLVGGTQYNAFIIPDACGLGDCLSRTGQRLSFSVLLYVSEIMSATAKGTLMWRTKDFNTRDVLACTRVPIYIQ